MFVLSERAYSETTKQDSINLEISFDRSLSLRETSQSVCIANQLTGFFVMMEV